VVENQQYFDDFPGEEKTGDFPAELTTPEVTMDGILIGNLW
jgi:hypothetical protein